MKRCVLVLLVSLLGLPAGAQKRAFTIEDLYRLRTIEDPQVSPDGTKIAFSMREDNLVQGTGNSEIYVVGTDGSNLRRMTHTPASDNTPRWSPDGSHILFLSGRTNGTQAWSIPLNGGEPSQITNFSPGVAEPTWTPDGRGIIFASDVFPECGASDSCNKAIRDAMENGPLQAHMADALLYRHWTSWKDGRRSTLLYVDMAKKSLRELTPGDYDAPSFSLAGTGYAVSPDGRELCFVSNRDAHEAETTNRDLWIVPLAGGPPRNITASNKGSDSNPVYSPDGKYIAYLTQSTPNYEADIFRIALFDRKTQRTTILSGAFDNWVTGLAWEGDSQSLYFTADVKGHTPLYRMTIGTRAITSVVDPNTIDAFSVAQKGTTIALVRRSVGEPRELWTVDKCGGPMRQLTAFNTAIADSVDIRPAEEIWVPSPSGRSIHTFIVKPHGFDPSKKYPLILNVHGGPQMQWTDGFRGDWQVYPGAGYVVAFPNPHGSTGYGQEFTAAISHDWGGKVFQDVLAVTDTLARLPYVDADRMGAMGWSYGGYMMMWLEGHTQRFKALAAMMGVYNLQAMHGATEELWFPEYDLQGAPWESELYQKWTPNAFVRNFKTPCLVITGERDYRVPYTQSLEFFTDLQKLRVPSRLIVFENDGHWPSSIKSMPFYYNAHLDWFHKYLGGDPAPYDMTRMWRNQAFGKK
jgi:dipeptidyl aminopeptidase/acylaminoacyl peptidase